MKAESKYTSKTTARIRVMGILERAILISGVYVAITFALTGCDKVKDLTNAFNSAANTLQNVGTELANGSVDFTHAASQLKDVIQELPKEAGAELREALDQAAKGAAQAAGIEGRCSIDFARVRISEDIKYMAQMCRAYALGRKLPQRPFTKPDLCQANMNGIRRDRILQNGTLVWDGWGFDAFNPKAPKVSIALETRDQRIHPVDIFSQQSSYKITADLSRSKNPVRCICPTQRILLLWGNEVISEVNVEEPPPPTTNTIPAELVPWGPLVADRCANPINPHADREFGGSGPKVEWSVNLSIANGTELVAHIHYHAIEWRNDKPAGDKTEACGEWDKNVYSVPNGWRIIRIRGNAEDKGINVLVGFGKHAVSGGIYSTGRIPSWG